MIFQIYERVFASLSHINKANILILFKICLGMILGPGHKKNWKEFSEFIKEKDFLFLLKLIVGAVAAIIGLSSLMKFLIVSYFSITYALFFGLILVSIIIPVKMLTHKKAYLVFFMALGAALTIYVTWAVNPYEKVSKKSALYQERYFQEQGAAQKEIQPAENKILMNGKYTLSEYMYSFICGCVSVSAMVLPGVSGSLVLILMGEYFEVVSAISGLASLKMDNFAFLGCFSLGIILGGLFFARLISVVLKRYYNATMAFLIGLMAGSLYALWPFKKVVIMAQQYVKVEGRISIVENARIYTNINELPKMGQELYLSLVFFLIGCVIMSFFVQKEGST